MRKFPRRGAGGARRANAPYALQIGLARGFRGQTVVITVNGREVYRRARVTTNLETSYADAMTIVCTSRPAHVAVSVMPGDLVASLDVDVAAHPHVVISLIAERTVSFEIFGEAPATGGPPRTRPPGRHRPAG